jgi:hydrogenase/urease accessory protein HupE
MMHSIRASLLAAAVSLSAPLALSAHEGHAGDHGWLAGAAQPLLSLDHFLAGVSVAVALTIGVAVAARLARRADPGRSIAEP